MKESFSIFNLQLEPHVNGPFTPDLAHPISQLGKNAKENGWPLDVKVGMYVYCKRKCFLIREHNKI